MNIKRRLLKRICFLLCIVLIFACTSSVLLPHTHDCVETDCVVCAIIKKASELLLGIMLIIGAYRLVKCILCILNTQIYIPLLNGITPVGLKVKLSD